MTPRVDATPGALQALKTRAGEMQATFAVPQTRHPAFAAALLGVDSPREGTLVVRDAVFPPYRTCAFLGRGLDASLPPDTTIVVDGSSCAPLLVAALTDGIDFWFTPKPGGFMVFADHDEYATVFAPRQGPVSRVSEALRLAGFHEVPSYRRKL